MASCLLRAFKTPSDVFTTVSRASLMFFSAPFSGISNDAYEGFVNTFENIMGWYVYKIVVICVFFSAGGSVRIACIRIGSPP